MNQSLSYSRTSRICTPMMNLKMLFKKSLYSVLADVAQWIEPRLQTKGSLVWFPVRAHAWVVVQVPSGGHMWGNHTLMFLSLSFSLPSPPSKNKYIKSFKNFLKLLHSILTSSVTSSMVLCHYLAPVHTETVDEKILKRH